MDERFRERFEPFSWDYKKRISSLYYLHENGLNTWVSIEPYPTPNIIKQDITVLLERISFVDKIVFGRMNYNKLISEYPGYQRFYNESTETVADFCRKNSIEFHIKDKTLNKQETHDRIGSGKSKRLFRRLVS